MSIARERYFKRCPKPDNYTDALAPGEMRKTFDRILSDPAFAHLQPEKVCSDPPIILFHNFLSGAETDAFVRHGKGRYAESLGVGMTADGKMGDVRTEIRTSAHGGCQHAKRWGCARWPNGLRNGRLDFGNVYDTIWTLNLTSDCFGHFWRDRRDV